MLALVTAAAAHGLDPDLAPLRQAFVDLDVSVDVVDWDDHDVDWSRFDAAILRSTWDYVERLDEFVGWLDRIATCTRIVNARNAIDWNLDKHYLAQLHTSGIPIVPTTFVEVGSPLPLPQPEQTLQTAQTQDDVWVVKPAIGAGSNGAKRCTSAEVAPHIAELHGLGRAAMVQPYLDLIDVESETSLVFINDGSSLHFDHAFSKAAILTSVDVEQDGDLFAKEEIGPRAATDEQRALAEQVLSSEVVAELGPLAYARVDVAPMPDGPVLMELELIEPSLYFEASSGSADRAAMAWQRFLTADQPS